MPLETVGTIMPRRAFDTGQEEIRPIRLIQEPDILMQPLREKAVKADISGIFGCRPWTC
jgi:hypothetical protein